MAATLPANSCNLCVNNFDVTSNGTYNHSKVCQYGFNFLKMLNPNWPEMEYNASLLADLISYLFDTSTFLSYYIKIFHLKDIPHLLETIALQAYLAPPKGYTIAKVGRVLLAVCVKEGVRPTLQDVQ